MGWFFFDDAKCQGYINAAMTENAPYQPVDKQTGYAWNTLKNRRDRTDPDGDDRELAAAEHYLWARWIVGSGQLPEAVVRAAAAGYDPAKLLGYVPAIFAARKLLGHSWSRPSTDSVKWGLRGCTDGAADKRRITPDPDARPLAT